MKKSSRSMRSKKKKPYTIFDYIIIIGLVVLVAGGLYYFLRGKNEPVKAQMKSVKAEPVDIKSENIQVTTQGQSKAIKSKKKSKKGTGPKKEKANSNIIKVEPVLPVDPITDNTRILVNESPVPVTVIQVPSTQEPIQTTELPHREGVNGRPNLASPSETVPQENLNIDYESDDNGHDDSSESETNNKLPNEQDRPIDIENSTNNEHEVENNNDNIPAVSEPNNVAVVPEPVNGVELDSEDILPAFFDTILEDKADVFEALITQVLSHQIVINLNEVSSKYKYNALHFAAMNGKLECLRVIIRRIESFNFKIEDKSEDEFQNNALFLACYNANRFSEVAVDVVQVLLENSSDTNSVNSVNDEEYSLLFAAIMGSDAGVVSLLLDKWNADINYVLPIFNDTVLHIAMESCSRPVMKVLIAKGADVHAVNYYNREPIHEAAALGCVDGLRELILTQRIDKHHRSLRRDEEKENNDDSCLFEATPLHFAAYFGQLPTIEFLFLIQSDYHAKDQGGNTAANYSRIMRKECNKSSVEVDDYFFDRLEWEQIKIGRNGSLQQLIEILRRFEETGITPDNKTYRSIANSCLH